MVGKLDEEDASVGAGGLQLDFSLECPNGLLDRGEADARRILSSGHEGLEEPVADTLGNPASRVPDP